MVSCVSKPYIHSSAFPLGYQSISEGKPAQLTRLGGNSRGTRCVPPGWFGVWPGHSVKGAVPQPYGTGLHISSGWPAAALELSLHWLCHRLLLSPDASLMLNVVRLESTF